LNQKTEERHENQLKFNLLKLVFIQVGFGGRQREWTIFHQKSIALFIKGWYGKNNK
jgi:hypothetical protein